MTAYDIGGRVNGRVGMTSNEQHSEGGVPEDFDEDDKHAITKIVDKILAAGLDGVGPLQGAREVAEHHRVQHVDVDVAIQRLIATHTRLVAATGFATGLGGCSRCR
jgi:hypothetical protein